MRDGSNGQLSMSTPIDFGIRFVGSRLFIEIFQDGMSLVEKTADYLDGEGRKDARKLDRHMTIAYATESMRLTTRLMQLASWLLLQRAVGEGEMTPEEALSEKHRANLSDVSHTISDNTKSILPASLMELINRSIHLYERVVKLDAMLYGAPSKQIHRQNPVTDQQARLQAAFQSAPKS